MNLLARVRDRLRLSLDLAGQHRSWRLARNYRLGGGYERVYLYHIRKTGGTSLNYMFLALGGEASPDVYSRLTHNRMLRAIIGDKVYVGWNKPLIEQGRYFYAFSHIPAHQLTLPGRTFTITCLRDPVTRVLSLYRMLVEYRDNNIPHPMMVRQGAWLGHGFADFLERIPRRHLLRQLFMFSEAFSPAEAFDRIRACSHYFFLEDFAAGVRTLSEKLQIALEPLHVKQAASDPVIHQADIERLRSLLEPEYVLYHRLRQACAT